MAKYALHAGGVVTNVVEADSAWIAANHPTADLLQDDVFVSLGFVRNGPGDYSPPPRFTDAEVAKAALWTEIKAERDRRRAEGGTYVASVDKWFHSDDSSRIQQIGLVIMGANVPAVQWKTMDGTFATMSQQLAGAIFAAAAASDQALFAAAETARATMEADPLNWSGVVNWPLAYGE